MATNVDIFVDAAGTGIISNAGSVKGGVIPALFRNDVYNARIRVVDIDPQTGLFIDTVTTIPSLKLGIGEIDAKPTSGEFRLTLSGPVTSGNIPYNATTTQVLNAVSGIAGNVVVTTFGIESNAWVIQAATANTALSFGGVAYTLFPTSTVQISTRRNPATDIKAEQIIKLKRSPAVFSDSFSTASTDGVINFSKVQDGSATQNETYLLSVGADALAGAVVFNYGSQSNALRIDSLRYAPGEIYQALNAITGLTGNIDVGYSYGSNRYSIQFIKALGLQNITTALSIDSSGVQFANFKSATVTMATAELDAIFSGTTSNTKTLTLEIEGTLSGSVKTLGQKSIVVRRDLVSTGDAVPSPQASYYTKAETDAAFVPISATNVDSTNRVLHDSGGTDSVDWQNRKLYDGSTEYIAWNDGLGFYGTSPIAKPSGANAVSNVISLGLIASSSTYGVLPSSTKTLATTQSIWFGTVPNNNTTTRQVTMTGAQLNDIVMVGAPADLASGLALYAHVVSANTVEIDVVNGTNGSVATTTGTFRLLLIGY